MKNILKVAAIAMVTVMLCLTLASCGGPNADPDDALAALKENTSMKMAVTKNDGK